MSWHYSQALAAAYSAGNCSDGKPSAPLNSTGTPEAFSWLGKTTVALTYSQSGTTSGHSTGGRGEALLTWFLADSHARTSAQPEKAQESQESGQGCGESRPESLAKWDRVTSSWKTHQCSLFGGLESFSATWPRWGIMRDGECWALTMPAHLTSGTGSGSWPTPCALEVNKNLDNWKAKRAIPRSQKGGSHGPNLATAVRLWPTPVAKDGLKRGEFDLKNPRNGLAAAAKMFPTPTSSMVTMADMNQARFAGNGNRPTYQEAKMWPTPTAQDSKNNGAPSQMLRNTKPLNAEVGGSLNPTWVEWLMGWPLGWTEFAASATDRFQQWLDSHGGL